MLGMAVGCNTQYAPRKATAIVVYLAGGHQLLDTAIAYSLAATVKERQPCTAQMKK